MAENLSYQFTQGCNLSNKSKCIVCGDAPLEFLIAMVPFNSYYNFHHAPKYSKARIAVPPKQQNSTPVYILSDGKDPGC